MCRERRCSKTGDNQYIKPSMLTTDRIMLDCLPMAKDPIKRMPPGGCAVLEGSHHKYRDTR
jgi:hypothetical protein